MTTTTDKATSHTETPWEVHEFGDGKIMVLNKKSKRGIVCFSYTDDEARANAAFIVKACNNFDAMKEALEAIKRKSFFHMVRFADEKGDRKVLGALKEIAIEALAKIEGEK